MFSFSTEDQSSINSHQKPTKADQPANLDDMLRTPAFGSYENIIATYLTNKATGQGFEIDNLGIMDIKTVNSVFSEYNKKDRDNIPKFSAIKIQQFLHLQRKVQGTFLSGQAVMAASILPILYNIDQDHMAASAGIDVEDKDIKSTVTPVIFNSPDKVIQLLYYWEVVLA